MILGNREWVFVTEYSCIVCYYCCYFIAINIHYFVSELFFCIEKVISGVVHSVSLLLLFII